MVVLVLRLSSTTGSSGSATHKHKPTCSPKPSNRTSVLMYMIIMMLFAFDLRSRVVSMVHVLLQCINCSGMCACLPALCCWRWTVWCMHASCFDCDVHCCFELLHALSQSSWIRCYINVTYYYYYCGRGSPGEILSDARQKQPCFDVPFSVSSPFLLSSALDILSCLFSAQWSILVAFSFVHSKIENCPAFVIKR